MTEITRSDMIAELTLWGYPARNTSLLSDKALEKEYRKFAQPITDEMVDEAFAVLEYGG